MRRKQLPQNARLEGLKTDLRTAQQELLLAYGRFDQAVEPELVESCIYEINAVNARFDYLYRAIKEQERRAAAADAGGVKTWV